MELNSSFSSLGILYQIIFIEAPQQNSTVERKYKHLLNVTRSLLFHSRLSKPFLVFFFMSCYLFDK